MSALGGELAVALKEWAAVIDALAQGRQIFLLRKGGIAEGKRGFELRHSRFLLFPTWEHQHAEALRPDWRERFAALEPADDGSIAFRYWAEVVAIEPAPADREVLRQAREFHVWQDSYLDVRYDYRPDLPLFVVFLRVFELPETVSLAHDRRYRGCRSWVDLYESVRTENSRPALSENAFMQAQQAFRSFRMTKTS
jgi:hypothetical protein